MNDLRGVTDLDRLIHEPARLLIVTILASVVSADFLFLQRETGLTKGNLSAHPVSYTHLTLPTNREV